jgi:predicted metal-dependent phosphoesterase TrpH
VELLALTDHDSVDGVDEALDAAAAEGIGLVPAAELSALDGEREDVHILGYGLDHRSRSLRDALQAFCVDRTARIERMAEALRGLGLEVELPDRGGASVGRPHLAQAAFEHPANSIRLEDEQIVNSSQLLEAYLIPGAPAYRRRTTPTVEQAIEVIHDARGIAVWAHPFYDLGAEPQVLDTIDRFRMQGLDGVEAFYVTHTERQTRLLAEHCEANSLLTTGSADFHGPNHPHFHRFRAFQTYDLNPRLGPIATLPK